MVKQLLTAGIVGLGRAGRRRLKALEGAPDVAVTWAVETHPDGPTPDFPLFSTIDQACSTRVPDMVLVCTPPGLHESAALQLMDRGVRNLLVEKPVACTSAAAVRLERRAQACGATIKVGSNLRQFPEVRCLANCVQSGRLGRVSTASFHIGHDGSALQSWARERDLAGGGTLLDNGVHIIDLAHLLDLIPSRFTVEGEVQWCSPTIDEDAQWFLRCPDRTLQFSSSWRRADGLYLSGQLSGDLGTATITIGGAASGVLVEDKSGTEHVRFDGPADSWGDDTRHFLDGVRGGWAAGATGAQAASSLSIVDAVYAAAAKGASLDRER